jgi:AcrR family transcriptional regulator
MSRQNSRRQLLRTVPKPDLPPRKSERTREAILESALEFLWTRPFRDLTVGEVMSGAGSSRSAFYQYFTDLHELMEILLLGLKQEVLEATTPWFHGEGDPLPLLNESLQGVVQIGYQRGPILRAVTDAASNAERLEKSWLQFLKDFDDAVTVRIEEQQEAGWVPEFDARTTAVALNRMDVALIIHAFGRRPRRPSQPVLDAMLRIWSSTLYPNRNSAALRSDRQ